eukprot:198237-Pelagomonas_calceolata.AAC.1
MVHVQAHEVCPSSHRAEKAHAHCVFTLMLALLVSIVTITLIDYLSPLTVLKLMLQNNMLQTQSASKPTCLVVDVHHHIGNISSLTFALERVTAHSKTFNQEKHQITTRIVIRAVKLRRL